jgi:Carboxypeptidase regulatory-like domain/TonB-dependent Receptor Plug Domain
MDANNAVGLSKSSGFAWLRRIPWLLLPILLLTIGTANAQQLTGTLSGIAMDQADARVAGAKVVVKNDASGDIRNTVSDSQGFFSVTALPPGSYTVTVSQKGFAAFEETGIMLSQGDTKSINARLKISSSSTDVTVVSGADAEVPTDTAEVSATLNNELVDSSILTSRNAAELLKIMPGVAFSGNGAATPQLASSTNNGPAGSYSANGTQPYGTTDVYLDGANLIDPGNAGTQVANINQDMTDSVKYLSASYGAEYAKGPAVLQAFGKSGGQKFHGEGYFYARNSAVGFANDWYNKSVGEASAVGNGLPASSGNVVQPQSYYYMGGNVGGPIFFPHFNHNRDKLFFWGGYEYMKQNPYVAHNVMNVPTPDQLQGNFRTDTLPSQVVGSGTIGNAYTLPCSTDDGWQGCGKNNSPWGAAYNPTGWDENGQPTASTAATIRSYMDPVGQVLGGGVGGCGTSGAAGLLPCPNITPSAATGWNNYLQPYGDPTSSATVIGNRWEATGKLTYAFNDNNKLWGSYAYQSEDDTHSAAPWWNPANTIAYPSNPIAKETAHLYLANYTHVFSATSTNEVVFAYAKFVNDMSGSSPSKAERSTYSLPTQTVFSGKTGNPQIPNTGNTTGWVTSVPWIGFPALTGGIYGPNSFGKTSEAPSISDVFTKIVGTHSIKAGFYWDAQENLQSTDGQDGAGVQGNYEVATWGGSSTYNATLDRLMGRNFAYEEVNTDPVPDELWHQWSLWGQDQWKVNRKLTLTLGLRADHMGQWYDKLGPTQVWDPSTYVNGSGAPPNTGLVWAKTGPEKNTANAVSGIPSSGFGSKLFSWAPRVGVAYDMFGTGRSVIRAGFGTYYYQISNNYAGQAMTGPLGSFTYGTYPTSNGFYGYGINGGTINTQDPNVPGNSGKPITLAVPVGLNQNGSGSVITDKKGDNLVPYANTYSFGIAQALPAHTVAEISYVGSASRNQLLGSPFNYTDVNASKQGALFTPDPAHGGQYVNLSPISGTSIGNANDWRPMNNYQSLYTNLHGGYSNYNSLQVSGQKQSGNLFVFTNFTFGKVLGVRDSGTANGNGAGSYIDPYSLKNNYGPLAFDHTKIYNLSASYKLPSPIHHNAVLGQAINGWQLSTYTTYQDGGPLQSNTPALNMNYQQYHCGANDPTPGCTAAGKIINEAITLPIPASANGGNQTYGVGVNQWYGTAPIPQFEPVITCDIRNGVHKGQYFNPNCFRAPLAPTATTLGEQGQYIWPYARTPHYFGSDLAIFKAFRVNDSQRFEVRVAATNWLNHPNSYFGGGGNADDTLLFNGISSGSKLVYNSQQSTTGTPLDKNGFRWIQFAGKYYF